MNTPIADFLEEYARSGRLRLHMPGHKGVSPFAAGRLSPEEALAAAFPFDLTEIAGADALYEAAGIIGESEENAAALYGAGATCYSTSGSTLCIQAMLALACGPGREVIAARNAHISFWNTCALLELTPRWMEASFRDDDGVSAMVTPGDVERAAAKFPGARAVYLTSPDYLGCRCDIRAIAAVCRKAGLPLLVDNAHGAHLPFLSENEHPLALGASLCCDSAHKTLPVLTGGAYLHLSREFAEQAGKTAAKEKMALFGTTSPSYLILLSLDLCNRYLEETARADFAEQERSTARLWEQAGAKGFRLPAERTDCLHFTLDGYDIGMTGGELADWLRGAGIECEYASPRYVVCLLSPRCGAETERRLGAALRGLTPRPQRITKQEPVELPEQMLPLRAALFAPRELCPVERAAGRIAAETRIQCPPGVPVVAAGERIGPRAQKLLKMSGISAVHVIK